MLGYKYYYKNTCIKCENLASSKYQNDNKEFCLALYKKYYIKNMHPKLFFEEKETQLHTSSLLLSSDLYDSKNINIIISE